MSLLKNLAAFGRLHAMAGALTATLVLTGCAANAGGPQPPVESRNADTISDIAAAAERWQQYWQQNRQQRTEGQKSESYEFVAGQQCYCLPEARAPRVITVKNNAVTAMRLEATGAADPDPPELLQKTISQWFDYLQQQAGSDTAKVSGTFDAATGFPKRISVDLHPRMADDEFSVVFSGFNPS